LKIALSNTHRARRSMGMLATHQRAAKRPIVLLNHMDVVTSDAAHWRVPPFSGEIKDGWLWGRGAQDMKDEGLAQLVVMVMLKREKSGT
jgi:acetylornithine deacetylase/succinyl-diaminopimelate desuccinylase-like protein